MNVTYYLLQTVLIPAEVCSPIVPHMAVLVSLKDIVFLLAPGIWMQSYPPVFSLAWPQHCVDLKSKILCCSHIRFCSVHTSSPLWLVYLNYSYSTHTVQSYTKSYTVCQAKWYRMACKVQPFGRSSPTFLHRKHRGLEDKKLLFLWHFAKTC